jgi:uncharacterized repeat protein (TIGR02543 family)
VTNPYRLITVSQNAVNRVTGHKGHSGGVFDTTANHYRASGSAARDWGDIIPGNDADGTPYNGASTIDKNWDASGKAFFPGGANAALCSRMTALQFYNAQVSARSGLTAEEQTAYGLDDSQIIADLTEQEANEDVATLAALGGTFTTSNITTSDTLVTATTDSATSLGSTGATLNGTIKAGSVGVRWRFEYGTSSSLTSPSSTTMSAATDNDVDMITSTTVAVNAPLTGLTPSTTYYYRVVGATNYGTDTEGLLYGSILSFTTAAAGTHLVAFNANGGSGSMAAQSGTSSTALTSSSFTRAGYTFAGWATAANGSGTTYADGASYPFDADVTLYAQWTAVSQSVAYDANGGSGAPGSGSAVTGATFTVSASVPTRSGFTFAGWNTASNGSGTSYASSATFTMPASSVTLYAQWTANPGGGSGSGSSGGGNGNSGGGNGNSGGGNSGNAIRPVTSGPLTPPATTTNGSTTNQSVAPLPTVTVPLTTGDNTPVVVTKVENKGPGKVDIDEKGQLKITVPIGFTGTVTILVNGFEKSQCTTAANGSIACPVGTPTPIQQTIRVQVSGPTPQVVPDQRAADLPRGFAPRSGELVVVGMDSEVGLNWKQEAGTQYYQVSSGGELVCMTVYTSCIVPAQNRRSRSYVVSSVKSDGASTNVAKGTGWARPSGTRLAAVYFDSASGKLTKKSVRTLRRMVRDVKALGLGSVYVIGHTDTRGSIQYNRTLSEIRARNVHDWIENHLEDAVFNEKSPQGELKPAFSEAANPGDWRNRRVDVLVQ